jgi:hypothetical protein
MLELSKDAKVAVISRGDWKDLLKTASNKFRIKAKRVFSQSGAEISADDFVGGSELVKVLSQLFFLYSYISVDH